DRRRGVPAREHRGGPRAAGAGDRAPPRHRNHADLAGDGGVVGAGRRRAAVLGLRLARQRGGGAADPGPAGAGRRTTGAGLRRGVRPRRHRRRAGRGGVGGGGGDRPGRRRRHPLERGAQRRGRGGAGRGRGRPALPLGPGDRRRRLLRSADGPPHHALAAGLGRRRGGGLARRSRPRLRPERRPTTGGAGFRSGHEGAGRPRRARGDGVALVAAV
ncbi:MAG: Mlr4229 protein, partial [uncultured Acetobacteraceae bacterium]